MILFEWASSSGELALSEWRLGLQKSQRAKLDAKVYMLEAANSLDDLPMIVGPISVKGISYKSIYKMRIGKRGVSLRPLLCKGTGNSKTEATFLAGATERDGKFDPKDAPQVAERRREALMSGRDTRRRYESPPKAKAN